MGWAVGSLMIGCWAVGPSSCAATAKLTVWNCCVGQRGQRGCLVGCGDVPAGRVPVTASKACPLEGDVPASRVPAGRVPAGRVPATSKVCPLEGDVPVGRVPATSKVCPLEGMEAMSPSSLIFLNPSATKSQRLSGLMERMTSLGDGMG